MTMYCIHKIIIIIINKKNNNNDNNNNNNNNEYERMTCVLYDACKLIKLMNCITNNEHVYKLTDGS